jgi:hypothetical protein
MAVTVRPKWFGSNLNKNKKRVMFKTIFFSVCLILLTNAAGAQTTDVVNLDKARVALDVAHNCDEATRLLNLVSPDYRQTADYLLCMAKTQDCKKNNEQALYYYKKYLLLTPASDTVIKRVAELTDQKKKGEHAGSEVEMAKASYQAVAKTGKRHHHNLTDNYYSSGLGYGIGLGGDNAPYKSAFMLNVSDGIMLIHNKAVLDFSSSTGILLSPNKEWFAMALASPAVSAADISGGYSEVLTVGLSPVIINQKNIALTIGALAGVDFYFTGAGSSYATASIASKITFCYGVKSTLYLGENVMIYMQLQLNAANTADISSDYIQSYTVPANYNILNMGISYKFDAWW